MSPAVHLEFSVLMKQQGAYLGGGDFPQVAFVSGPFHLRVDTFCLRLFGIEGDFKMHTPRGDVQH